MYRRLDKSYKVICNKKISTNYFKLSVKIDESIYKDCLPGRFFMINIPGVFLRRPMSIYHVKNNVLSFLYKVVGKGTKLLSNIKEKTLLNLLGPLGNGYNLKIYKKFNHVLIAGGTGIASISFLITKLKKGILYYGARSKKDLLFLDKFKKNWEVIISTDDGSKGYKGHITDLLSKRIKTEDVLYACGPNLMLENILYIAREKKIKGFISLEERMACGFGNCQGCAIMVNNEIKMVCKDGPIFDIKELYLNYNNSI
ncbi:MAG: dihydroorotate dehydrogenase electron transfer subunit [Endomicrobium sp.]|jgi:dihydroorotate dehydrogenase electron transfer subunit|nr:dihydroorotate dehydrogenase electron transfer subunit [Endomicrobium sp.]